MGIQKKIPSCRLTFFLNPKAGDRMRIFRKTDRLFLMLIVDEAHEPLVNFTNYIIYAYNRTNKKLSPELLSTLLFVAQGLSLRDTGKPFFTAEFETLNHTLIENFAWYYYPSRTRHIDYKTWYTLDFLQPRESRMLKRILSLKKMKPIPSYNNGHKFTNQEILEKTERFLYLYGEDENA